MTVKRQCVYVCDFCGTEILVHDSELQLSGWKKLISSIGGDVTQDMCPKCFDRAKEVKG